MKIAAPGVSADKLQELVEWADRCCPVSDAVRRAVPATVDVQVL